jgi:ribosome biogenesis GTPase
MLLGLTVKGRVTKIIGGLYTVDTPSLAYACKPRGLFRKDNVSPLVGDIVTVEILSPNEGLIVDIAERTTLFNRPKVANVHQVILVFALKKPSLNFELLDRLIINSEALGISPVLCFNKRDLLKPDDTALMDDISDIYGRTGYKILFLSTITGEGKGSLESLLKDKLSVFAGPSGAGKSSLLNLLVPEALMETGELSRKIERGKHTTRHTELFRVFDNTYIIDSPGFSSVFFDGISGDNLCTLFREFKPFRDQCKFLDCKHINEPDCAVKQAVSDGFISNKRYERYIKFYYECGENYTHNT